MNKNPPSRTWEGGILIQFPYGGRNYNITRVDFIIYIIGNYKMDRISRIGPTRK
jgi:hypothetical protein